MAEAGILEYTQNCFLWNDQIEYTQMSHVVGMLYSIGRFSLTLIVEPIER